MSTPNLPPARFPQWLGHLWNETDPPPEHVSVTVTLIDGTRYCQDIYTRVIQPDAEENARRQIARARQVLDSIIMEQNSQT